MENPNQKHLTLEDRNYIEQALNHGMTFKETELKKYKNKSGIIWKNTDTTYCFACAICCICLLLLYNISKKIQCRKYTFHIVFVIYKLTHQTWQGLPLALASKFCHFSRISDSLLLRTCSYTSLFLHTLSIHFIAISAQGYFT